MTNIQAISALGEIALGYAVIATFCGLICCDNMCAVWCALCGVVWCVVICGHLCVCAWCGHLCVCAVW